VSVGVILNYLAQGLVVSLGKGNKMNRELEQWINVEAEWVLEKLSQSVNDNDRNYYQGRIDSLANVKKSILTFEGMRA
jgi:hypothetical protein